MHIGKSLLSTQPHANNEGRPTKFRETEEQDIPPAKRTCKQATKHDRHEHRQERHSGREDRQDRHSRREDCQDRHGRREDRQDRHGRREDRQDRHGRREDRQDRHGRREDRQDRHGRREDRQDRHGRREDRQDRHGRREDRQGRHGRREDRQDRHSREDRQDRHSRREDRQDRHSRREDRQDRHSRREDRQDRHSRREDRQDRHSRREDRQDRHSRREDRQDHHSREDRQDHHSRREDREYCQSHEHYNHHLPPIRAKTLHQQPHYQSRYQNSVYMCQPPHQHPSPFHSPPSMGKQHPQYYQPSIFQSSKLPLFQPFQTPFHPFCQAHSHAPVQSRYQPARPSTSQSSPRPSPDSPRGKYAQFLRDYYTRHQTPCTKWPSLNIKNYINLAVINNDYANREDLVKFREQTIHGSIDDILDWKAPIDIKDILKPNSLYGTQYPVTQLLIEGAPGIGKSTFAWEVCQKWGQHQLFSEYSLVVLLKFRDKRTHEARTVADLFYYPLSELQSDIILDIVLSGGRGLLLILEGFDEAPASKRTMDSIFVRLFTGQELPKATVVLTTRPSASAELRQFCNSENSRRIEIVGFGKKEIDEYIQCAFPYKRSRSDFNEYLSLYPHIHSMMYVPLNSAIVTHVYESCKSSGTVVPKTMTQLYSSLIRALLLRYLKDKEEYKDTCTNINSFKDLPQPVYDQFCEICEIGYTGMMSAETKLIFQDLPSDFDTLGLMQTCPELYVDRGASVSYNFLHLTVQEYLAAYHISQQSRDEQVVFMRDNIFKLKVVVRFLAGLTELGRDLWDVVREFASEDKRNVSTKFLSTEGNFIKLEILHLLFESQNSSAITSVLGSDCVCFGYRALQPFGWYVLGYCIAHSSCDWKLELEKCKLESVELFLKALNLQHDQCQLAPTGKIKEMGSSCNGYHDPAAVHLLVDRMPQLLVFQNLTRLGLVNSGLTSETCNLLSKHTDLLQHLEYLNLSCNDTIGRGGAVNLITSLTKFSTIRELNFRYTGIGFEDCKALSELLGTSKHIEVLDIGEIGPFGFGFSSDSVQLIIDGLSHNTSLEKLDMRFSHFSSENVLHLASVLRVNTRLKELNIRHCSIQSSDSVHLAKALEENTATQLHTLELSSNRIGSKGAVAFAGMLKKNHCLKTLDLCDDDSVGVESALKLIESLKHNTTLEELKLSKKCEPRSFSKLDKTLRYRVKFQ